MAGEVITYGLLFISLYFEVFLLVAFLEWRLARRARGATSPLCALRHEPLVTIVVPCFNEERTLKGTLESLLTLDYPKDKLDIIVVDDGSTDSTHDIACSLGAPVRIFRQKNGGKHTAMNHALKHSTAELIGCLDADSVVAPDGLRSIVPLFKDPRIAAVTPGIHVRNPRTILQHMQHVEYRLSLFSRFMLAALGSAFITPGPFSVFRASVVRELGGWRHGHSTEDMEMALRIQQAGHLIGNAPKAVVHTGTPAHLRGLFRQRVRWTYGWLRNAFDYRSMIGNKRYGNLSIIILPSALISVATAIYFFAIVLWNTAQSASHEITRFLVTGMLPHPSFDLFYFNTSALWFLVCFSVALVLVLISAGSLIGTSSRRLPIGTPLFVLFYCFLAPLWLSVAAFRATFRTGVRWK